MKTTINSSSSLSGSFKRRWIFFLTALILGNLLPGCNQRSDTAAPPAKNYPVGNGPAPPVTNSYPEGGGGESWPPLEPTNNSSTNNNHLP